MPNRTWPEVIILVLILAASTFAFWRRIAPVIRTIRACRKDPGWSFQPVGRRIRDFVWEVLLQGKVIRERPLPGIAHALVFWGFCAFALITLDHVLAAFGLDLIEPHSGLGRIYFPLATLFAIAVILSMMGLAFRRFVLRPRWLGHLSKESAAITALILMLMITYLLAFRYREDALSGRLIWWAHTLALLVFLPLIPKTKHLHLILSPVTIFLTRGSFARIPPLEGDEDFGIQTGRDISNLVALQAFSCVECGRCTEHCPANNTGKVLDPKQIALGVRQYLRDHGAGGTEPIVGKYVLEEALFQCTSCGACEYQCPVGIEHVPIIVGLRRGLVNTGQYEDQYGNKLFLSLEKNGNAMGFASIERDKFVQKADLPIFDGTQEYCLWLGCMGSYDPRGREIIAALVTVLRALNVTFGVLRKEKCSGDPVRRLGNDYLFSQLVESNLEQLRAAKVTKMLSICPHCVRTASEDWAEAGGTAQIEHHSTFLARHSAQLTGGAREQVVFHDPCYLGRYRGIYDEPRQVAGDTVDPERARERSFCCGAGGGLAFLGEEKGKRVNLERAQELARSGAPVIGAACPFCNTMFRDALSQIESPPKLLDIAQIAAARVESAKPRDAML